MRTASILAFCLLFPCTSFAADIYVPDDYSKIQDAINAALVGDTVIVRPGTYIENIDFLGKAITVQSEQGPNVTVLDGNQAGSVVTFQSGEDLTSILDSFTIQNGTGTYYATYSWYEGGGIYLLNSSATIRSCIIRDNNADHGGGIGTRNASPEITDCFFLDNTATYGGGGMGLYEYSAGQIRSCTFQSNVCLGIFDGGAGICCIESPAVIEDCIFLNNDGTLGGAIWCDWYSAALITRCIINGNSAGSYGGIGCQRSSPIIMGCQITDNVAGMGGGIGMGTDSNPVITDNTISRNTAQTGYGGGLYCQSPPLEITKNLIEDNVAYQDGGGIYWACTTLNAVPISGNTIRRNSASWDDGLGGGIYFWDIYGKYVSIMDNKIEENIAEDGAGIYFSNNGDPCLLRNFVFRNRAKKNGGGMYISTSEPEIINCVISQNLAEEGGGIYCMFFATFTNCTVADNRATEGAGLYCANVNGFPTIVNSIVSVRRTTSFRGPPERA